MKAQKRKSTVLGSQFSRLPVDMISSPRPTIKSLPQDLLIEVIARVAASSLTDLVNAKLAARDLLQASTQGYIFQKASLGTFSKHLWNNHPEFWSFVENCNENGNPEALYRKGMLEFFTHCKEASGWDHLKASAEKGHAEACYVYGLVLYSASLKEEGMEFLNKCEAKLGADKMAECRRRVKELVRSIWINNKLTISSLEKPGRICDCVILKHSNNGKHGWDWSDDEENYEDHICQPCKWHTEVSKFCNMLRTGRYNN